MKSHPPKLYISQNTEGTWFVRLGEEKKKKSVKAENLHILIFSRAVVNFFLSTKSQWCQSGNVPNYIIWSFFFFFLVVLTCKELNWWKHILYLGKRRQVKNDKCTWTKIWEQSMIENNDKSFTLLWALQRKRPWFYVTEVKILYLPGNNEYLCLILGNQIVN